MTIAALGLAAWAYPKPDSPAERPAAPAAAVAEAPPLDPLLVAGRHGTVSAVDPSTGAVLYDAREGLLSPTGASIYSHHGDEITIRSTATGVVAGTAPAPDRMSLRVASRSGRLLAFARPPRHGASEWLPLGRKHTKITVTDTAAGGGSRTYDLEGNFGIEAFSTADDELFLIEYLPAMRPWHYGLRRMDLDTGKLRQIARDKQNAPGQMNGTGRLAVFSPQGNEIYTLYTQQGANYTHVKPEQARPGKVYAFVHQLNLDGAWTHCIDLPAPFGTGTATSHAMAISQDGSRLYVADPSSGGLAAIDPRNSRVLESVTAEIRPLRRGASATVSPDGTLYLAGPDRVLAYDGESLDPLRSMPVDGITTGIATSADGSELYAGTRGGVLVLDAETGELLRTISLPGARGLVTGA